MKSNIKKIEIYTSDACYYQNVDVSDLIGYLNWLNTNDGNTFMLVNVEQSNRQALIAIKDIRAIVEAD